MDEEFKNKGIPWENCLSLGSDNASVMVGHKKGVFAFMKQKNPNIFLSGCTLHLVHIAAEKAADTLPISLSDILVDIYYYFRKSSKRQQLLAGFQELYSADQAKILKHCSTRWLSIERCLERLLQQWVALKKYFKAEKSNKLSSSAETKITRALDFLRSPTCHLFCLFLHYTQDVYSSILVSMQADEPKIHLLRRQLHTLIRSLLIRFVKPSAMANRTVDTFDYKLPCNQKADKDLIIGEEAQKFITNKDENHLRDIRVAEFYKSVKSYFVTACDYLLKKLPLNEPVLIYAEVADVHLRASSSMSDLSQLIDRFPALVPSSCSKDKIAEEFALFQCTDVSACLDSLAGGRMDDIWTAVGKMKDDCGAAMFGNLTAIMKGILTIPHSSAHCERIFSCVRKNRTDQRPTLGNDTLEALLVLKSQPGTPLDGSRKLSNDTLRQLKGAYMRSLQGESTSSQKDTPI